MKLCSHGSSSQVRHKKNYKNSAQERRAQYDAEREKELAELREQAGIDAERAVLVEEERKRLLREHAVAYKDYLPKGI